MTRPPQVPEPETELEEFFELSIDPLSIIGFDGEFKRVNASFVRLLGYTKAELFSRSVLDILHPDDVEPAREALARLAEVHDLVGFEARVIGADGAVRWLEWNARSMPERGVVYSVGRDTTERRRVDAELLEAQRLLEASRDELRVLAEEQAALRRVATLVAQDVPSRELFGAVAREVGTLFCADFSGMLRYEDDESVTTVATWAAVGEHPPVPARWATEPGDAPTIIASTRAAARVDDWTSIPGLMAEVIRNVLGVSSSVGCPIVVEGRLWGALAVHSRQSRPLPPDTESRISQFTDLVGTAIANAESRGRADRLAEEQATLRRLATLVARETPLEAVFAKVAEEVARTLGDGDSALWRDDGDGTVTAVAVRGPGAAPGVSLGTRLTLDGDSVIARVLREGRPHRIDDFSQIAGSVAERARELGMRSAVGCPIVVGSRTWGAMTVAAYGAEPFAPETETRVARFSDLVATAIANAEARAEVERLAAGQAALRRVATLVAKEGPPAEVLVRIAEQVAELLGDADCALYRDEGDGTATVVGVAGATLSGAVKLGSRWPTDGTGVIATVLREGRPHRIDDFGAATGTIATVGRDRLGVRTAVGCPIVVGGRIWGAIAAGRYRSEAFPAETDAALARFAELAATAVANAEARAEIERLAEEQAALRRVATLVAKGVDPAELFSAVTQEVAGLFSTVQPPFAVTVIRFDPGPEFVLAGASTATDPPIGARWRPTDFYVSTRVHRTGGSARVDADDLEVGNPEADTLRRQGYLYQVGSPIVVEGRLWGAMTTNSAEPLPPDADHRLEKFTELVATAIANAESRAEVERLAAEQSALRRVATLVAEGASPSAVMEAVAAEMERALGADAAMLLRYEPDEEVTVVARRDVNLRPLAPGTRVSHAGENVTSMVRRTGRPARIGNYERARGPVADLARALGSNVGSAVGAPIVLDRRLWGVIITSWAGDASPPEDTEERMAKFAQLLDTAIANADSRDQLISSRARVLTAGDEARRRVVRDLHDGAQQRLVHTIVMLKLAQRAARDNDGDVESLLGEALEQAEQGNRELRELAHGIMPAMLTRGGLRAGVEAVVARLNLPVRVDVTAERFPAEIEASAYFIVAEALTNVVKHSNAGRAEVTASLDDGKLRIEVRDDGAGGADPDGLGLVGMRDRVMTLGGRLEIESPAGGGTLVAATLPLSAG